MENLLITGGAGFIGSNFIKYLLSLHSQGQNIAPVSISVINLDSLTYAGNLENLKEIELHPNYRFIHGSIQNYELVKFLCSHHEISGIINFAAESHVDRSIMNAKPFVETNVTGTLTLLEVCRELQIPRFLQISTDEVYGSLGENGFFTEETPLSPNSPYSASKAAADHLVLAYVHTFGINAGITRCSNNYGPYQFPEKLIPLMILNASEDKPLPVYGDGLNVRDWIHVEDHCSAVWLAFKSGKKGEVYNIGGRSERNNLQVVKTILNLLGKPESMIQFVKDRPGHDRRYSIDSTKIENELGWRRVIDFETGLANTIDWYLENPEWCNNVRSGAYREYYRQQYGKINM